MSQGQAIQIAFAVVGAAIGGPIGGAAGASIGFAIGSVAGAIVAGLVEPGLPNDVFRQDELQGIQTTLPRVGAPRPVVYGAYVIGGNVIHAFKRVKFEHREEIREGGAGGVSDGNKGGSTISITFTYQEILGIGLCEGPVKGFARIYADTNLIYDASQPGDWTVTPGGPDGSALAGGTDSIIYSRFAEHELEQFTLFLGTGTQEPWTFAELLDTVTAGDLPAYRGLAWVGVVFNTGSQGRLPNFRFEVIQGDDAEGTPLAIAYAPTMDEVWLAWTGGRFDRQTGQPTVRAYSTRVGQEMYQLSRETVFADGAPRQLIVGDSIDTDVEVKRLYLRQSSGRFAVISQLSRQVTDWAIDTRTAQEVTDKTTLTITDMTAKARASGLPFTSIAYTMPTRDEIGQFSTHVKPAAEFTRLAFTANSFPIKLLWNDNQERLYVSLNGRDRVARVSGYATLTLDEEITVGDQPNALLLTSDNFVWVCNTGDGTLSRFQTSAAVNTITVGSTPNDLTQANDGFVWVANTGAASVSRVDGSSPFTVQTFTIPGLPSRVVATGKNGQCWVVSGVRREVYRMDTTGSILNTISIQPISTQITVDDDGNAYIISGQQAFYISADGTTVIPLDINNGLSCIVRDISVEAGVPREWVNVNRLDATSVNTVRARVAPAKSFLDHLAVGYQYVGREVSTGVEYFFKGGTSYAAIPETALSTAQDQSTGQGLKTVRSEQKAVPTKIVLRYKDADRDYEDADQTVQRVRGPQESETIQTIALGIAYTDSQTARDIAEILLHEPFYARTPYEFSVSPAYALLEAGDIVSVTGRGNTETVRIGQLTLGQHGDSEIVAIPHRSYLYEGFASRPTEPLTSDPDIPIRGVVSMVIVEPPPLKPSDEMPRVVPAVGLNDPDTAAFFPETVVNQSIDNQQTYAPIYITDVEAVIGDVALATGGLPTGQAWGWDSTNTITVILRSPNVTLSSSSDLGVLNGANWCMIGAEVLGFVTATLQTGSTYVLSRLLRGLQGTETEVAGHSTNEVFLLLDGVAQEIMSVDYEVSRVGLQSHYKPVRRREVIADVTAVTHTADGTSVQPWAPVIEDTLYNVGTGDFTIQWLHRSRLNGAWLNGQGITYDGDDTQTYRARIFSDSTYTTVLREITVTTFTTLGAVRTYLYTAALQATDFGAAQLVIFFDVTTLGQVVGKPARGQSPAAVSLPFTETFYGAPVGETAGITEDFEA